MGYGDVKDNSKKLDIVYGRPQGSKALRGVFLQNSTLPHGRTKGEIYAQAPPKGCFQKKKRVTVAPKISAERAAANAPIIINRDSQLFKNYQQQRLPR